MLLHGKCSHLEFISIDLLVYCSGATINVTIPTSIDISGCFHAVLSDVTGCLVVKLNSTVPGVTPMNDSYKNRVLMQRFVIIPDLNKLGTV